ncbi:MAG: DsbA family protein, partial [Egibacteraceae bacterium]
MDRDLEFLYVGDPMCSWCWGFAPAMARLGQRYTIPIRVIVGGLRPGADAGPLDDELRAFLLEHWLAVAAASGQPFTTSALQRPGWVYDTEAACRAVVALRELAPDRELAWFARLQQAFYADGEDVTDERVLVE